MNTHELWHPEPESTDIGRANRPRQPILYLGQDGRTALFELSLKPGEHVTVATFEILGDQQLTMQDIGVVGHHQGKGFKQLASGFEEDLHLAGYTDQGIENVQLIHRFLREEFLLDDEDDDAYNVSSIVADAIMTYAGTDCLLYASKRSVNDYNIAVKPDAAKRALRVTHCDFFLVDEVKHEGTKIRSLLTSTSIQNNGRIDWSAELPDRLNWYSDPVWVQDT